MLFNDIWLIAWIDNCVFYDAQIYYIEQVDVISRNNRKRKKPTQQYDKWSFTYKVANREPYTTTIIVRHEFITDKYFINNINKRHYQTVATRLQLLSNYNNTNQYMLVFTICFTRIRMIISIKGNIYSYHDIYITAQTSYNIKYVFKTFKIVESIL